MAGAVVGDVVRGDPAGDDARQLVTRGGERFFEGFQRGGGLLFVEARWR